MRNPVALILTLAPAALLAAFVLIAGTPSDLQAAMATAAAAQDAQAQAHHDAQLRAQLDHLSAAMALGRPDGISAQDWAAATRAVAVAQGGRP